MNTSEFEGILSEIWDSSEYYKSMTARRKKEKTRLAVSLASVVAAVLVISITVFASNTGRQDMLFTYYGFDQSVIKVGDRYYLFYTGDKEPRYAEYNGKKYYLGDYGSVDYEKVDAFIEERGNAYRQVVEEYGDYSYTVETADAIITYYNDADTINKMIAEKMPEELLTYVAPNGNVVEGRSLNGTAVTLYVFEGSGGEVLFVPAQYPTAVRFYVVADKVNKDIEEKSGEVFYNEIINSR